jgi:hypothetical protein
MILAVLLADKVEPWRSSGDSSMAWLDGIILAFTHSARAQGLFPSCTFPFGEEGLTNASARRANICVSRT